MTQTSGIDQTRQDYPAHAPGAVYEGVEGLAPGGHRPARLHEARLMAQD